MNIQLRNKRKNLFHLFYIFCLLSNTNQSFSRYGEETFCFCRKFISNFVFRKQKKGTNFMEQLTRTSFQDIYSLYYKKAFYFAKSYVHDDLVAEDIASESLIALWEKTKENPIDYVAPLSLTILKNKSLDYLKHEEVQLAAVEMIADWKRQELSLRISALEACIPNDIFSEEITKIIHQTLAQLPEQTRKVFIMSRFYDKSNKEIAEKLGISVKGVEYHISKALKFLRVALKDYLPFLYFLLGH